MQIFLAQKKIGIHVPVLDCFQHLQQAQGGLFQDFSASETSIHNFWSHSNKHDLILKVYLKCTVGKLSVLDLLDHFQYEFLAGQREVDPEFRSINEQFIAAEAARPRTKLVHYSELPRREKSGPRVEERFWHQAASGHTNPIKKRRKQTLKRGLEKHAPLKQSKKRCNI